MEKKAWPAQLAKYKAILLPYLAPWKEYLVRCQAFALSLQEEQKTHFTDQILLQVLLHTSGIEGAIYFCEAFEKAEENHLEEAFCLVWKAKTCFSHGLAGMLESEHDIWKRYYDNDCLTDVRLTIEFMDALLAYLRIQGEGADRQMWHREYVMAKENRGIMLVTTFQRPLADDALAEQMCKVFLPQMQE